MNKELLLKQLRSTVHHRLLKLDHMIEDLRASNNDTKSSMGDKYETGREMLQQEINRILSQKSEVQKQYDFLERITDVATPKIALGSLVETDKQWFYISISFGTFAFDSKKIITISPEAPLAKALLDATKDDHISFNKVHYHILNIY